MAGGSLTLTVDSSAKLPELAQRVLCAVAAGVRDQLAVQYSLGGGRFGLRLPEEAFPAGPTLPLKRGGANVLAGYVAGSHVVVDVINGNAVSRNVNGCPVDTNQPTTTGAPPVVLNVGGNPRAITLNYANVAAAGVVNIYWGDGTSTLGAAESGAANHTYPDVGVWRIRVEDASDATQFADFVIKI